MIKTSIRSALVRPALAALAAVAMLPAIAAAQTPDQPPRKPAAQERNVEARTGKPDRAGPERHAVRRDIADRRADPAHRHGRDHNRDEREDRRERRG